MTSGSNGDFSAGVGYDMVTGIGSFDAAHLLAAAGATSTTLATTTSTVTTTTAHPTTTTTASATTSTTTTTVPACLPSGASCSTDASCCSGSCKVKAGTRQCR